MDINRVVETLVKTGSCTRTLPTEGRPIQQDAFADFCKALVNHCDYIDLNGGDAKRLLGLVCVGYSPINRWLHMSAPSDAEEVPFPQLLELLKVHLFPMLEKGQALRRLQAFQYDVDMSLPVNLTQFRTLAREALGRDEAAWDWLSTFREACPYEGVKMTISSITGLYKSINGWKQFEQTLVTSLDTEASAAPKASGKSVKSVTVAMEAITIDDSTLESCEEGIRRLIGRKKQIRGESDESGGGGGRGGGRGGRGNRRRQRGRGGGREAKDGSPKKTCALCSKQGHYPDQCPLLPVAQAAAQQAVGQGAHAHPQAFQPARMVYHPVPQYQARVGYGYGAQPPMQAPPQGPAVRSVATSSD